jgi:sortase A
MMRKTLRIGALLIALLGMGMFAYPHVAQRVYRYQATQTIIRFDEEASSLREGAAKNTVDLAGLYEAMEAYNKKIYEDKQTDLKDMYSYQEPSFNLREWGLDDDMVGYLDIARIGIKLPIYLGASEENMALGAAHLSQTSLPIGSMNTNSVIAAHRGMSTAAMFRDIEDLQVGDEITLTNLWETLTYRVMKSQVIEANEVDQLHIQPGKDLVTLITCHPYQQNYQRYVVYCERIADTR